MRGSELPGPQSGYGWEFRPRVAMKTALVLARPIGIEEFNGNQGGPLRRVFLRAGTLT